MASVCRWPVLARPPCQPGRGHPRAPQWRLRVRAWGAPSARTDPWLKIRGYRRSASRAPVCTPLARGQPPLPGSDVCRRSCEGGLSQPADGFPFRPLRAGLKIFFPLTLTGSQLKILQADSLPVVTDQFCACRLANEALTDRGQPWACRQGGQSPRPAARPALAPGQCHLISTPAHPRPHQFKAVLFSRCLFFALCP